MHALPFLGLSGVAGRCEKACNPRMGNLALGRKLWADTTCGQNATELYCFYSENTDLTCRQPKCDKCNAAHPHLAHLPSAMADSSFRFPRTWWQSEEDVHREKIQLDLEAEFYFTHLIMVFKSPRPAAMVLDRSQDFGKTWKPYKYFATNCSATFGLEDDVVKKGAICTSKYSSPFPCTGGEQTQIITLEASHYFSSGDYLRASEGGRVTKTIPSIPSLALRKCAIQRQDCKVRDSNTEKPRTQGVAGSQSNLGIEKIDIERAEFQYLVIKSVWHKCAENDKLLNRVKVNGGHVKLVLHQESRAPHSPGNFILALHPDTFKGCKTHPFVTRAPSLMIIKAQKNVSPLG
ncbi:Netrin-4 [Saguinus oedipus]|uniref:Netrin-4 n=1 Tax=Saguinus oedipus TaxID=9490 RepID=A0ABQ9UZ65_SAGOE|nr:Netrin-4 [Saguinus oedipus]